MADKPNPVVLKHVTEYFIKVFPNSPPAGFKPELKIRRAFKPGTWMALADTFNLMAWMQAMDKSISQPQMADKSVVTIWDLALLITNTAGHAVRTLSGAEFPRARRVTVAAAIRANRG